MLILTVGSGVIGLAVSPTELAKKPKILEIEVRKITLEYDSIQVKGTGGVVNTTRSLIEQH